MTERWTDETLDRFATTITTSIQANIAAIAASTERTPRIDAAIAELSQAQLRMMQESSEYRRDMTEMRADMTEMRADFREMMTAQTQVLQRIDEMQAEVRGLQTENRRILDHVFGRESN